MASYIYSKVQEAIGGKSVSSGFQKNWSPNKIRALFIMRDFIMVVDYLSGPKMFPLNPEEVGMDLLNPNRVGSLNNLLSSRQLSCLEEIYADEAFSRYPNVLDLQAYAASVVNSASRLRYYAYTSGIVAEELRSAYYKAFSSGAYDFTYARNIGGIRYVDTGNKDWYKRHNLRPQYYGPDAEGGNLAAWFNKVEKAVAKVAAEAANKDKATRDLDYVMKRVMSDITHLGELNKLRSIMKYCSGSSYEVHKTFYSVADEKFAAPRPVSGLSGQVVISAAKSTGNNNPAFVKSVQSIANYYKYAELYLADAPLDTDKLERDGLYPEDRGFLQVGSLFDRILSCLYDKMVSSPVYKYTIIVGITRAFPEGVPEGLLSKRLAGKTKVSSGSLDGYIMNYLEAFYNICGVGEFDIQGGVQ